TDSPALKQAELGVAVSSASDVAKASASAVLTESGLSEILETIIVSRGTFQRIMTWVMNKITKVVEVVILFTIGYFIFQDMIISLLGMTLLVFANDFVTISIATDNVRPSKEPNKWKMKGLVVTALVIGLLFALEDLLIAFIALKFFHVDLLTLQTLMMFALVLNTQIRIMTIRERGFFFASAPKWSLVLISIVILAIFIFISLSGLIVPSFSPWLILITFGVGLLFMVFMDLIKYLMFKSFKIN
ncbi:MAG: plasma-membrane proton-efflux P-type ATPase, partial [Bacilli bacterium]